MINRIKSNKTFIAIILMIVACIIWSGNFVIARGVNEWMNPFGLGFWRWAIAFCFMLPFAIPRYKTEVKYVKQNIWLFIIMGVIGVGCFNTIIYLAAHHTTANNIALLASLSPVWTLIIAGALKIEKLNIYKVIGMMLAMFGATEVIVRGDLTRILQLNLNIGDLMVILTSILWAVYSIGVKKKPKEISNIFFISGVTFFGLIFLFICFMIEIYMIGYTPVSIKAIGVYLYVGVFASVVAWLCFNKSIEYIGAVQTSLLYYTMPIFSAILAIVFLDEAVKSYHVIGFTLIFIGILISYKKTKQLAA